MLVDLSSFSIFPQKTSQNPLSSHPKDLCGHTGLGGTLSLTGSGMPALSFCCKKIAGPGSRVYDSRFDDNLAVFNEFLYAAS